MLLPALLLTPCAPPTWALLQINQAHLPRACGRRAWRCRRPPPRAARPRPAASRGRPRRRPPPPPAPPAPEPRSAPRQPPPPRRAGRGRGRARAPAPRRARAARPWRRARAGPPRRARRCGCGCARSRARWSASAAAPARPPPRATPPACRRARQREFSPQARRVGAGRLHCMAGKDGQGVTLRHFRPDRHLRLDTGTNPYPRERGERLCANH